MEKHHQHMHQKISFLFMKCCIVLLALHFTLSTFNFAQAAGLSKPPNNLNLVGYWSFNENTGSLAGDASGNGNSGTLTPGAGGSNTSVAQMWEHPGKYSSALDFDGTDDFVSYGDVSALKFTTNSFTASAWIKTTDTSNYKTIIMKGASNAGATDRYYMRIEASTGKFHASIADGTNEANISGVRTGLHDGAWHHVVMVVDKGANTMYTYVDGVQDDSTSITSVGNIDTTSEFKLGKQNDLYYYKGIMDDVRVYSRALTAAQVKALYGAGAVTRKGVSERGLIGYWSFDEGVGAESTDQSGNGSTGTVTPGGSGSYTTTAQMWTRGRRGAGSLQFDGTDSYVDIPANSLTNYSGNTITMAAWVYPRSFTFGGTNTDIGVILQHTGPYYLSVDGNGKVTAYFSGVVGSHTPSTSSIPLNAWSHVAITYDGSNIRWYINGALDKTLAATGSFSTDARSLKVGGEFGFGRFFNAIIDEVRLYNRALSAAEIESLYNTTTQRINSSQNTQATSGLINNWSFNGPDISNGAILDRAGSNTGYPKLIATSTFYTAGKVGQGLEFNGTNKVDLASSVTLSHTSNWSITLWAKTTSSGEMYLVTNQSGGPVSNALRIVSGVMNYYHYNGVWNSHSGSVAVNDGNWHHLAWVNSSNATMDMYVDGVLDANDIPSDNSGPLNRIGNIWDSGANGLIGTMDELRFYNRTLSAAEVKQLYLMGK